MKYKIIEQKTWDAPFALVVAPDKDFTLWLNEIQDQEKFEVDDDENLGGYYSFKKTIPLLNVKRIIWLPSFKNTPLDIGILGHELLHYTIRTLSNKGIRMCPESEEAYTYLFDTTLSTCLKVLLKK